MLLKIKKAPIIKLDKYRIKQKQISYKVIVFFMAVGALTCSVIIFFLS